MIRRALVRAWFKALQADQKRLARDCIRMYRETGERKYREMADIHVDTIERLKDAWDGMRVL